MIICLRGVKMAGNNDYNYYKSEYGKFKDNYYKPGNNNRKRGSGGKNFKRFIRAFFVFLVTFGIVAVAIFGGVRLYKNLSAKKQEETTVATTVKDNENQPQTSTKAEKESTTKEKTTAETTTKKAEEKTTKSSEKTTVSSSGKIVAGSVGYVSTSTGEPIYLRHNPTYNEAGYAPLTNGTEVVISEISQDGQWGKTSNFDIDGWVNLSYISVAASSSSSSSSPSKSSDNLSFGQALTIFGNDTSQNLYMNCKINSSSVKGIADYKDSSSKVITTFSNGQNVPIYSVRNGYGKTRVNNVETWIPTQYLDFVSWGHYR